MTARELLQNVTGYPIPDATVEAAAKEAGFDIDGDFRDIEQRSLYRAYSRVYLYVALAPNVSEGGVSVSLSASDKAAFLRMAKRYAQLAGDKTTAPSASYGYKGENL